MQTAYSTYRKNSNRGFTLTETLVTLVIVGLASMCLATGISLATKNYSSSMASSQAQTLCATLTSSIENELRYATTVTADSGTVGAFTYFSNGHGADCSLGVDEDGYVTVKDGTLLVSKASYPRGIKAEVEATYNTSTAASFDVTVIITDSIGNELSRNVFQVKNVGIGVTPVQGTASGGGSEKLLFDRYYYTAYPDLNSSGGKQYWMPSGTIVSYNGVVYVLCCRTGTIKCINSNNWPTPATAWWQFKAVDPDAPYFTSYDDMPSGAKMYTKNNIIYENTLRYLHTGDFYDDGVDVYIRTSDSDWGIPPTPGQIEGDWVMLSSTKDLSKFEIG